MTGINELPDELLRDIFLRGCEDIDTESFDAHANTTRRHPLALSCRNVCLRWRWILDSPFDYRSQFHTFASLAIRGDVDKPKFAVQLRHFRQAILSSQGSDIWLRIHLPIVQVDSLGRGLEYLSKHDAMFLKLFIHGFETIIPFRNQLVYLEVHTVQPQLLARIMQFLTSPEPTLRLSRLTLVHWDPFDPSRVQPISSSLMDMLERSGAETECLLDFSNLNEIELMGHHASWILSRALRPPSSLTSLQVPEFSIHETIDFFHSIQKTLRSLTIYGEQFIDSSQHRTFGIPSNFTVINFPLLWYLEFNFARDTWVEYFLECVSCPQLNKVILRWLEGPNAMGVRNEVITPSARGSALREPGGDVGISRTGEHITIEQSTRLEAACNRSDRVPITPVLMTLGLIKLSFTKSALHCIEKFAGTVNKLVLDDLSLDWVPKVATVRGSNPDPEYLEAASLFQRVIAPLRPTLLELNFLEVHSALFILTSLDTSALQSLRIIKLRHEYEHIPDLNLRAPRLVYLSFLDTNENARKAILRNLIVHANDLEIVVT